MARYTIRDDNGNTYTWNGEAPTPGPVATWSDGQTDTDLALLACDDGIYVNIDKVVSFTPVAEPRQ